MQLNSFGVRYSFGAVYNPHRRLCFEFLDSLENTMIEIMPINNEVVFLGDLNIDLLDSSDATIAFQNFLEVVGFMQLVKEPTRITSTSATFLDVILVTNDSLISNVNVSDSGLSTDHCLISCDVLVQSKVSKHKFRTYRNFKNFHYDTFPSHLKSIPWNNIYLLNNINDKVAFLNQNVTILLDIYAPFVTAKFTKPASPWLTNTLKCMIKIKNSALSTFKRTRRGVSKTGITINN